MKKLAADDREIRTELNKLGMDTQNRFWELRGINPEKARALESATGKKYAALYDRLRELNKNQGKEVLEQHELSINREMRWINAMRDDGIARVAVPAWLWCHCHSIHPASCERRDQLLSAVPDIPSVKATNSWDAVSPNKARPMVDVSGQGAGTTASADARVWYTFSFIPPSDGKYCINPTVMMSGYWLLWTWGDCAGTTTGSGELKVMLRVRVDQLSSTVKTMEKEILSRKSPSGLMSGWNYDSVTDGGSSVVAYLEGGHEAVVVVEAELSASIANYGRAVVDMSTNSNYYYWVKHMHWGKRHCLIDEIARARVPAFGGT